MWQLPAEATGVAVAVLVFSFFCWMCNWLMIWLTWVHHERLSYVACISYFPLISTLCSMIQQLHEYIWWQDVAVEVWKHRVENVGNPTLVISNGATGVDLVLFYIQYYCYAVEATLVLFWAFSLTASVYGWSAKSTQRRTFSRVNLLGKTVSVVLPIVVVGLLQVQIIQDYRTTFIVIADFQFITSCAGGAILLMMILIKYIHSRRQFQTWTVGYGDSTEVTDTDNRLSLAISVATRRSKSIYDRWLVIRFTIAFVALAIYECAFALFQCVGQQNNTVDFLSPAPVPTASKAIRTSLTFIPGVTASLIPFVVFGTTRQFRSKMYDTFVPRCLKRRPPPSEDNLTSLALTRQSMSMSMSQPPIPVPDVICVSKGVDISYSMNDDRSPTQSSSNYDQTSEDENAILPMCASPARIPARGPWEDAWEPSPNLRGVRWQVSSPSSQSP